MKKLILGLTFALSCLTANALSTDSINSAGWSKLTEEQKADVIKSVAQAAGEKTDKAPAIPEPPPVDKVKNWAGIGTEIGKMIGSAAREIGVAANDFVKTPVGMMTATLIVWHFIGKAVVSIIFGLIILLGGTLVIRKLVNTYYIKSIEYDDERVDRLGRSVIKKIYRRDDDGGATVLAFLGHVICWGAAITVAFTGW